jgi:hypothetical protein
MRQQRVTETSGNTAADVLSPAWSPFCSTAFTLLGTATVVSLRHHVPATPLARADEVIE